ncbi:Nucleoside diphosphate kinase [Porphyridium purpureum]|uniref:nucleoside-diphosphate kinase n=1 Tax=Porphyridium purpureum TaxID=35688 RepID=A0A5J4YL94_PORPP|nr:Nucleoside diphosphate kinase [Porphyridium purpureum]|eukprot:POR5233..scf244_11
MGLTFIAIKPDGVHRGLVGEIIARFEKRGLKLCALKVVVPEKAIAEKHYEEHAGKPFYPGLVDYLCSGPIVAMVWSGKDVVAVTRKMIGATKPAQSEPGTIRGDLALDMGRNVIHGSDSDDSAQREIKLWFKEEEVCSKYVKADRMWVYEVTDEHTH